MTEPIGNSGIANTRNPLYIDREYKPFKSTPISINVGEYFDNDSKYDEHLGDIESSLEKGLLIDDLRSHAQSNVDRFANAAVNNLVIAGTTAVTGIPAFVYGIFHSIAEQDISKLWDNPISNLATNIQEAVNNKFTVYRGNEYNDKSLWQKLGTGIFWADLVQNLGYTEGMLVPGVGISRLLGSAPRIIQRTIPSILSAIAEASTQAVNSKNEEIRTKTAIANEEYNRMVAQGDLSEFALQQLNSEYMRTLQDIENDAVKAGNFVYGSNIALLTISNATQFSKVFTRGAKTARRLSGAIKRKGGKYVIDSLPTRLTKEFGKKLLDATSEGIEEVSQSIISNAPSHSLDYNSFNLSIFNPEKRELASSIWSGMGQTIAETLGDSETATEFAMGFLTGALGVPTLRKSKMPIKIENNTILEMLEAKRQWQKEKKIVDEVNARLKNEPDIKEYYNGLVRHLVMQDRMNTALDNDDIYEYKNAESAQLISDMMMFDNIGDIQSLKTLISESVNMSDQSIDNIIQETSKDGEGPFMMNGNPMSRDEVRTLLQERIDLLNSKVDNYTKDKQLLEQAYPKIDSQTLSNALFLKQQSRDHQERFNSLLEESFVKANRLIQSFEETKQKQKPKIKKGEGVYVTIDGKKKLVRKEDIDYYEPDGTPVFKSVEQPTSEYITATKWDFFNRLMTDDKYKEYLGELLEDPTSTTPIDERENLARSMLDLLKLNKNLRNINKQLDEILSNPYKSSKDQKELEKQVSEKELKREQKKKQQLIEQAKSYSEVQDLLDNQSISQEDLDTNGQSQIVKDYKKARNFQAELYAIIDEAEGTPEQKEALKKLADSRFKNSSSLDRLMDEGVITEENVVLPDGQIVSGHQLADYIIIAKNKVNNSRYRAEKTTGTPTEDKEVQDETVGNDPVPTVPSKKSQTLFARLSDIINETRDQELRENIKAIIDLLQDHYAAYISSKVENMDDVADQLFKEYNRLYNSITNLPEYFSEEPKDIDFVNRTNKILEDLQKVIPIQKETSDEQLQQDNSNQGGTNSQEEAQEEKRQFYKSELTQYRIQSVYDGTFIPFIPEGKAAKEVKAVQGKVEYSYVDEGGVKVGDTIELKLHTEGEYTFILMYHTDPQGVQHVVGVMPTVGNSKYQGLNYIMNQLKDGNKVTISVSQVMKGGYQYDITKSTPVKDMTNRPTDVKFGVVKPVEGSPTLVTNTSDQTEIVYDINNSDGNVYILLPNSKGTLSPKRVKIKHFNSEEFNLKQELQNGNTRATELDRIIKALSEISEQKSDDIIELLTDLNRVVHLGGNFHINLSRMNPSNNIDGFYNLVLSLSNGVQRENIIIKRDIPFENTQVLGGTVESPVTPSAEIYDKILNFLYQTNPCFTVRASEINKGTYNTDLINDNILYSHITDGRMRGSWFATDYFTDNGELQKAQELKGTFTPSSRTSNPIVKFNGKTYSVNKRGNLVDANENEVPKDNPDYQLLLDLAVSIAKYGSKKNGIGLAGGRTIIDEGKATERGLDITQQRYLTKEELKKLKDKLQGRVSKEVSFLGTLQQIQQDQQRVQRWEDGTPKVQNGTYLIMEEDGKYHEYVDISQKIDIQEHLPERFKNNREVKELCIQLFSSQNIDEIQKPSNMSDIAFNQLKEYIKDIKQKLRDNGDELSVNNIVIFKKLQNGERVAYIPDAISINRDTNEISIYTFNPTIGSIKEGQPEFQKQDKSGNSPKDYLSQELNAYKDIFESSYNFSVSHLGILPITLVTQKGDKSKISQIKKNSGIELQKNKVGLFGKESFVSREKPLEKQNPILTPEPESPKDDFNAVLDDKGRRYPELQGHPINDVSFKLNGVETRDQALYIGNANGRDLYLYRDGTEYKVISPNEEVLQSISGASSFIDALDKAIEYQFNPANFQQKAKPVNESIDDVPSDLQDIFNELDGTNKDIGRDLSKNVQDSPPKKSSPQNIPTETKTIKFSQLSEEIRRAINKKGITQEQFDALPQEDKQNILDCLVV